MPASTRDGLIILRRDLNKQTNQQDCILKMVGHNVEIGNKQERMKDGEARRGDGSAAAALHGWRQQAEK